LPESVWELSAVSTIPPSEAVPQAIRFVLQHPAVCSAIIGFAEPREALQACEAVC